MKIKLIISSFLLMFCFQLQAQKINWVESFGGKGSDWGKNVILDPSGNSIILGGFSDTCYFSSGNYQVSKGGFDVFISKQNQSGDLLWSYAFGNLDYNTANAITCDSKGDIYVVGSFAGTIDFNPGIGLDTLSSWIQSTGYVLKISSTGNFVWVKRIGGFLSDSFAPAGAIAESNLIKYDHNGSLIIGGRFEGVLDFDFSPVKDSIIQGMGNYILKIDSSGNFNWVRIMKNIDVDKVFTALQTDKNGYIISAGSFAGEVDFDLGPDTFVMSTSNFSFANFVLKLDSSGEFVWVKKIAQTGYLSINDIHTELNNKIVLCGNFADSIGFDPDNQVKNHYSKNQANSFLCIWTDSGSFVQSYSLNCVRNNFAQTIHTDDSKNIYLSGFSLGKFWVSTVHQTDTFNPKQNSDIYLLKFDSTGHPQWGKLLSGIGNLNQSNFIHLTAFNSNINQFYYTGFYIDSNNFALQKSGIQESKGFADIFLANLQLCNSNLSYGNYDDQYKINDTAYFSCTDNLSGSTYQWQEKIGGEFFNLNNDSTITGANTSSLSIINLKLSDNNRIFRCNVLADSCLTRSKNFTLHVVKCLQIIDSLIHKPITNFDEPLRMILKTRESEKNEFEWQYLKSRKFTKIPDSLGFSGIDNDTLIINQSKLENDLNYFRCIVNQGECSEQIDSFLHVTSCSGLTGSSEPIKYFKLGDTIQLVVQSLKAEQFSWEYKILGSFITITALSTRFKGMKNDTLLIFNADTNFNESEFRCLLINGPCQAYVNVITTKLKIENALDESLSENTFELYPNPSNGFIFIKCRNLYHHNSYSIYDIKGKIVKTGFMKADNSIEVNELGKGMYFIQLNEIKQKPLKFILN